MSPLQRRHLLAEMLELIARLEEDVPGDSGGIRQAATLLREGEVGESVLMLRNSASVAITATGWLIEDHLLHEGQ